MALTIDHPMLMNFVLLGDSNFVRFTQHLLGRHPTKNAKGAWHFGLCISGQGIRALAHRVKQNINTLPNNLMIGSYNLKQLNMDRNTFRLILRQLANLLKGRNVIFLTIPQIYNNPKYRGLYYSYKNCILNLRKTHSYRVVDTEPIFTFSNGKLNRGLFQRKYRNGKPDNLHLNHRGLVKLKQLIISFICSS